MLLETFTKILGEFQLEVLYTKMLILRSIKESTEPNYARGLSQAIARILECASNGQGKRLRDF